MENSFFQKIASSLVLLITIIVLGLFSFWAPASSFITSTVLFIDEGQNFFLSQKGALAVITSYQSPNNHVFFALLQTLLPDSLFYSNPLLLRLNNFIFVVLTLIILSYILNKYAKFSLLLSACLAVGLLTVSPVHFQWLLLARGYVLGLLLVIGGCLSLVKEKNVILSALFFGLSIWTVPTYGYVLPGILIARFCRYLDEEDLIVNTARTTRLGALIICITLIFYSPIVKDVIQASQLSWLQRMVYKDIPSFLHAWGELFGQPASSKILAPIILVLMIYCSAQILRKKSAAFYWAALLAGASVSYFVVIIILSVLDMSKPPFARNSMFTYTFVWGAVLMSSGFMHRYLRNIVIVVFFSYTLLNIQVYFFNPLKQIAGQGKPYTVFDHIGDIGLENIESITSGPGIYPVISMLTLENNQLKGNDPITFKKIGWGKKRQAQKIFRGACDMRAITMAKQPPKDCEDWQDWRNKALILTKEGQKVLICY